MALTQLAPPTVAGWNSVPNAIEQAYAPTSFPGVALFNALLSDNKAADDEAVMKAAVDLAVTGLATNLQLSTDALENYVRNEQTKSSPFKKKRESGSD